MAILAILIFLFLLVCLARFLYDRFWDRGLSCELSFQREYAVEDETALLREVVVNDKFLPMPVVEIDFHMDKRLRFLDGQNASVSDQSYRRDVFALSVRQQITRTLEFQCAGRGYFRIEASGITAKDLFLTKKYLLSRPQNTDFYVLPRPVPTEQINIPFSRVMGDVLSRKKVYDDPFEFAGLREYSRSDPMKYINWKASARAGGLLTNIHETTLSQNVSILLDMEGKGVQQADFLNEAAVRIACTLSERLLLAGISVSCYSNGTDVQTGTFWKAESLSGPSSALYLKKKFACLEAANGLQPIGKFAPKSRSAGGEDDLLVLITRSQREEDTAAFSRAVGRGRGVLIIPYRDSRGEVLSPKNVDLVWMEV